MKHYTYLILLLFLTSSCATIVSGATDEVSVNSEPQKEIQLTCHSFGQKGLNEIVFNIDLKKKTMKLVGHGEDLKVVVFNEDLIIGFIDQKNYFKKRYYSINRKSGSMKAAWCSADDKECLLYISLSIRIHENKKCEVIKDSLF